MKPHSFIVFLLSAFPVFAVDPGFSDGFERTAGPLADDPGQWAWDGVSPEIVADPHNAGTNWLAISTEAAESGYLHLPGPTDPYDVLWYDFDAVLAPRENHPTVDSDSRCAFYMTAAGNLRVRNGSSWSEAATGLDTDARHVFSIKLNFVDSTWSLWVDGDPVVAGGATLFDFANAGALSGGLRIEQEGAVTSNLDNVAVREGEISHQRITLDYLDDFEDRGPGPLADSPGLWTFSASDPSGEIKAALGAGSSQGLELVTGGGETATLNLHLPAHWQPTTWKQFDAVLAPYADDAAAPAVDADATVAFYLTEGGDIRVHDGEGWSSLGLSLDTSAMHRYTVRQDHASHTWKLWVDGTLVTPEPAGFVNDTNEPGFLRITQNESRTAVFDNVRVTSGPPPDGTDGLFDYSTWSGGIAWGGAASGSGDDPNANGLINLFEYAHGFTDPADGSHNYSTPVALGEGEGTATFTFRRNRQAEDLVFTVQTSPDLSTDSWTDVAPEAANVTVTPSPVPDVDLITIEIAMTGNQQFLRLRVETL